MNSGIRHLVSIDDLSLPEILELFARAKEYAQDLRAHSHLARGLISASLFYEPSTRTRLSFESAMLRLGGGVLTAADMRVSSASKGESLADTVRVVSGSYADIIVLRHASEGAARLATEFSNVPVINAGDGSHEHPTQTLCDLYNLWVERGRIEGLHVMLAGDLRYSRTIHSFVYALARFGANIVCLPTPGFELPPYVVQRLREEFGVEPVRADGEKLGEIARSCDAMYLTPQKPHQLSLFTDAKGLAVEHVDAVYMTRPQTERYTAADMPPPRPMNLNKQTLSRESLRDAMLMHPLPRRDEIASELDEDPRSIYFKQAARGVPIRMAILGLLLGRVELAAPRAQVDVRYYVVAAGENPCPNPTCISRTENRHVKPRYKLASRFPVRGFCAYCSQELPARWVGCSTTGLYHERDSATARQIRPDHLVFFRDEPQALALGFTAAAKSVPPSAEPEPAVVPGG
ncbi:MAG: aspartate carbamoyltransferase catalytic subunit [Planctomycetes bacterium]|nr:aspartate carbamoyltransferase catalytic subunit [Planctomycetota bacterium]